MEHLLEVIGVDLPGPHLLVDALSVNQDIAAAQSVRTGNLGQSLLYELLIASIASNIHNLNAGSGSSLNLSLSSLQLRYGKRCRRSSR